MIVKYIKDGSHKGQSNLFRRGRMIIMCCIKFFVCFFTWFHLSLIIQGQWIGNNERCQTPDRQSGRCLSVRNCQRMLDALDSLPQPLPSEIKNHLKSYQCGSEGNIPKVCCPTTPIYLEKREPSILSPPDVSKHRNLYLLPKDCGHLDTTEKIVNGNKTHLFEFPWMALLSYSTRNGPRFRCAGTIINNKYILTAAHCVSNLKANLNNVRVGEHDTRKEVDCEVDEYNQEICSPPYQDLSIEQVIPHPQYDSKAFTNDIALLRVSPINLSLENTRPVCLPLEKARNYNFTNRHVTVSGWGVTESGFPSPELLKVDLPAVPLDQCQENYKNIIRLDERQLCAGGRTKSDSCNGDSGGPLHAPASLYGDFRLIQQGIVSFGPKSCGNKVLPGVYTKVAFFLDWILDNIKQ